MGGRGSVSTGGRTAMSNTERVRQQFAEGAQRWDERIANATGYVTPRNREMAESLHAAADLAGTDTLREIYDSDEVRIIARSVTRFSPSATLESVTARQLDDALAGTNRPLGMSENEWRNVGELWRRAMSRGMTSRQVEAALRWQVQLAPTVGRTARRA